MQSDDKHSVYSLDADSVSPAEFERFSWTADKERHDAFDAILTQLFEEFPCIPGTEEYRSASLGVTDPDLKVYMASDTGVPSDRIMAAAMLIYTPAR